MTHFVRIPLDGRGRNWLNTNRRLGPTGIGFTMKRNTIQISAAASELSESADSLCSRSRPLGPPSSQGSLFEIPDRLGSGRCGAVGKTRNRREQVCRGIRSQIGREHPSRINDRRGTTDLAILTFQSLLRFTPDAGFLRFCPRIGANCSVSRARARCMVHTCRWVERSGCVATTATSGTFHIRVECKCGKFFKWAPQS